MGNGMRKLLCASAAAIIWFGAAYGQTAVVQSACGSAGYVVGQGNRPLNQNAGGDLCVVVDNGAANAALETGGNLAAIAAAQGAGGTGITQPTGGSGLLGWLSGIYSKLSSALTVSGTVSVSNFPSTQAVSATALPLPTGAATAANQPAINGDGGAQAHIMNFPGTQAVSGTITANAGTGNSTSVGAAASGSAVSGNPVLVAGSDGTNARSLKTDTVGAVIPSDALTLQSGSVTSATTLFSFDTTGYGSIDVQVTSAGTTCTITYEGSNDNTNWIAVPGNPQVSGTITPATTSTATGVWQFPATTRYFRARVSTYTSGTVAATAYARSTGAVVNEAVSSLNVNSVAVMNVSAVSPGTTTGTLVAPATPATTVIKASAGRLAMLEVSNSTASGVWVKVFNATSATLGTTSAAFNFYVAPGASRIISNADISIYLSTGIVLAVTGGASLTDNSAITSTGNTVVTVNWVYI
jgi:hypothetical protein